MKRLITALLLLASVSCWGQTQTIGNKHNTVRANGKLDADSGTYSKGIITLTKSDSLYFISLINTHAGTGSVTGKGKAHRIVVLTDTTIISSSNLIDSANYFTVLDTAIFQGKMQIPSIQTETIPGDYAMVVTGNNYVRKTPAYSHVLKAFGAYTTSSNDTLFLTTPTSIAGYGITDAYTKTNLQTSGQASVHWGNLTNTPTSLTGYNIADGYNAITTTTNGVLYPSSISATGSGHTATIALALNNQIAATVFAGPVIGSSTTSPTFRGLWQTDVSDSLVGIADGSTVTFDLNKSRQDSVVLTGSGHTLAFTNLPTGKKTVTCRLRIVQDATGGRTFNMPSGSYVANGLAAPYLNTNANGVTDWVILYEASSGTYFIKSCTW